MRRGALRGIPCSIGGGAGRAAKEEASQNIRDVTRRVLERLPRAGCRGPQASRQGVRHFPDGLRDGTPRYRSLGVNRRGGRRLRRYGSARLPLRKRSRVPTGWLRKRRGLTLRRCGKRVALTSGRNRSGRRWPRRRMVRLRGRLRRGRCRAYRRPRYGIHRVRRWTRIPRRSGTRTV